MLEQKIWLGNASTPHGIEQGSRPSALRAFLNVPSRPGLFVASPSAFEMKANVELTIRPSSRLDFLELSAH